MGAGWPETGIYMRGAKAAEARALKLIQTLQLGWKRAASPYVDDNAKLDNRHLLCSFTPRAFHDGTLAALGSRQMGGRASIGV